MLALEQHAVQGFGTAHVNVLAALKLSLAVLLLLLLLLAVLVVLPGTPPSLLPRGVCGAVGLPTASASTEMLLLLLLLVSD